MIVVLQFSLLFFCNFLKNYLIIIFDSIKLINKNIKKKKKKKKKIKKKKKKKKKKRW